MKRDMDLVRKLLLQIEERTDTRFRADIAAGASGEEVERLAYHIDMLISAGFLSGSPCHSSSGYEWLDLQLTWMGHEFLDTLRDPTVWERAKGAAERAGGASLQVLLEVGKAIIVESAKGMPR